MKFIDGTTTFCSGSCATAYDAENAAGLALRFTKPYEPCEDRTVETVITSAGPIYLKMAQSNKSGDLRTTVRGKAGPVDIGHYSCPEIIGNSFSAKVGMCLFIDLEQYYTHYAQLSSCSDKIYFGNLAKVYKLHRENIEKKLEGILLYKSPPFYNSIHSERKYPSCTLYIYDKEMNHEVQAGV